VRKSDFQKVFQVAGESAVINLILPDGKKQAALIYDVQKDYLNGEVIHVDFYGIRMDEKIKAAIPIELKGESPAVKEKIGILNKNLSEIEIEALPSDLPSSLIVDVSVLKELNQSIRVKDLEIPPGVKVLLKPETVILTVVSPSTEEATSATSAEIDLSAIKVESEEKKLEREKKKEEENV